MKRIGILGIIAGLAAVAYLGYMRKLPPSIQEHADKLVGWSEKRGLGEKVKDFKSKLTGDAPGHDDKVRGVKPAPRKVALPEDSFLPIALALEKKRTHLLYLSKGKARSAVFKGLIWWEEDSGVSRLYVEKRHAPVTGPNGEKMKTKRKSSVHQLRRFEYGSGETFDLHPEKIEGIVLDREDLTYPDEYKEFFLEERREILTVFGSEVVLGVHRATFLGGAHPVEADRTERIELEGGSVLQSRFERTRTAVTAAEFVKSKGRKLCRREHEGSVALRGPGGALIPAAVMGASAESCRGTLTYVMEKTAISELSRRGISMGHGARFRRGEIVVGETPVLKGVADVIPLASLPATVAVKGDRFSPPTQGSKARKRELVFKAFDRSSKPISFGKVAPLIGSVALDMDRMDDKDVEYLKQIFEVVSAK